MKRLLGVVLLVAGFSSSSAFAAAGVTPQETQFELASQPAAKIAVETEGWYRIRFAELKKAGFAVPRRTANLQLYVEGKQVPIRVTRTALEFYGVPLDTLSTKHQTYWLTAGAKSGLRIRTVGSGGATGALVRSVVAQTIVEPELRYFASILNGEASNFFGPGIGGGREAKQTISVAQLDPRGASTIAVALQGFSLLPHRVRVKVNEKEVGTVSFTGQIRFVTSMRLPAGVLKEGENVVSFQALGGELDFSIVDSVTLTHGRRLVAVGDVVDFALPLGRRARIDGFSRAGVRVLDVTTPEAPLALRATIRRSAGRFSATIGASRRTRHLVAFVDGHARRPARVSSNRPSRLNAGNQGADLVMITHRSFRNALTPLVNARQREGLKVAVVDVEDAYDEFAFGAHGPQAIKDFLAWTRTHWNPPPRFVVLVGDATYDPRNNTGKGDFDFVPTTFVNTVYLETSSDDGLVDFDGDAVPELAVGRLPVRTAAQANAVVRKLVRYDAQATARQMLLVSDKQIDYDFEAASRTLYGLIPPSWEIREIKRAQGPTDAAVRAQVVSALNQGPSIVNFFGHGSINIWTSGPIFGTKEAATLRNSRLSLYVMMTCLNGYFTDIEIASLGEALIYNPSGGAAAIWSSTGETVPTDQIAMDQKALGLLLSKPETRLGDAMVQAKAAIRDVDVRRTWVLFGDPTMRLH